MKVLITGAGGFIGSHLAEQCVRRGHDVRATVRYLSTGGRGWLETSEASSEIEFLAGDVRDHDFVLKAVRGTSAVLHLAALIGIPYSYASPLAYVRTNVEGTYNVLECARQCRTDQVVVASTSETYGTAQYVPIDENHPASAQSPYAATKIAADQLALSYHLSFGLPVKIVRPFNTYGPRQSARAVIPAIVSQVLAGEKVVRLGNTRPTRDFTFVDDTAEGFLEVMSAEGLTGEATNIGTGREISIGALAALILARMGSDARVEEAAERTRPAGSEVERLLCDNAKALGRTAWKPRVPLEEGLDRTISWMRSRGHLFRAGAYAL